MENKSITEKIVDGLHNAIQEIEEFRVQMALGRAEARDMYDENKKKFLNFLSKIKAKTSSSVDKFSDGAQKVKSVLKEMEDALDKAIDQSKESFEKQKKYLDELAARLDTAITVTISDNTLKAEAKHEIEKFKLKMELLKLQFNLKKLDTEKEFGMKKARFLERVDVMKRKLEEIKGDTAKNWTVLQKDLDIAYHELKKTVVS